MSFIKYLHPLWKSMLGKVNDSHTAVVASIEDAFTEAEKDAMELITDANLETATGEWLDEYGDIFGVFRKDNESDEDYRRRIINWILTERGTIGSIKDAIEKWLDDEDADVEIYEPFKNIFFLNKSKLNGPDHLLGKYYTSAVIDIRFTKHVPIEIIEEIRKFKAAGVTAKLTRFPNRKRTSYGIQESKVLRDRNFAIGSDISLEMWRPAGSRGVPDFNEKTSSLQPRNAFIPRSSYACTTSILAPVTTTSVHTFTSENLSEPVKSRSLELSPDAVKQLNHRNFRLGFNLTKSVTQAEPSGVNSYVVGVEMRLDYSDGTYRHFRAVDTSGVGEIPKATSGTSTMYYSNTSIVTDTFTQQGFSPAALPDLNKTVTKAFAYVMARGFVGSVELRSFRIDFYDDEIIPINTKLLAGTPANPITQPLGGVPFTGIIEGENLINPAQTFVFKGTGATNEGLFGGSFNAGTSVNLDDNYYTIYFAWEFTPDDPNEVIDGRISIQGSNPWRLLASQDIKSSAGNFKGYHISSRLAVREVVPYTSANFRFDKLKGTIKITNLKIVRGDRTVSNALVSQPKTELDKINKEDGQYLNADSVRIVNAVPTQVYQYDIFKVFEDRYGDNFFANKQTVKEKQDFIQNLIRNVRVDLKISATGKAGEPTWFTVRRWDALKHEWDNVDNKVVLGTSVDDDNIFTIVPEDIASFICDDGYVYIGISGTPNKDVNTYTRLAVDKFETKVEFKRGTTVFTSTEPRIRPVPTSTDWVPIPSDDYDKLLENDDKYITTEASKVAEEQRWGPAQIMVSFYLPDVVEKGIGSHVFRGVEDEDGKIQISKNLLSDLGYTIVARGQHGRDGNGCEISIFSYANNAWVGTKTFPETTFPATFETQTHTFVIPLNSRDTYVSKDGYVSIYIRSRLREGYSGNVSLDLKYAKLLAGLSQPDPKTIPLGQSRNLLLWTKDWGTAYGAAEVDKGVNVWRNNSCIPTGQKYNGGDVYATSANWGSMRYKMWTLKDRDIIKVGDKVVLSADVRIPQLSSTDSKVVYAYWNTAIGNGATVGRATNQWTRVFTEFTVTASSLGNDQYARFEVADLNAGNTFEFANYMLIKKPTTGELNRPYEQAPEEYLFAPVVGNQGKDYTVSDALKEFMGQPVTIAVDVEIVKGVATELGQNRNRMGTEINYAKGNGPISYQGSWLRVTTGMNVKERIYTTQTLTPDVYDRIFGGIHIQSFGDYVRVSRPSIYLGADNKAAWRYAPEDRGENVNIYDIAQFMRSMVNNKDRTYFALINNGIMGYKRLEKIIPVAEALPSNPRPLPKLTFAGKEWYMVPLDKIREEGADHIYLAATIKGGMLDNKGFGGIYLRETPTFARAGLTYEDTMNAGDFNEPSGTTRIAEYYPSYTPNRILRGSAAKEVPYGQGEVFTILNIDRFMRVTRAAYTQHEGYANVRCLNTLDAFIQFGGYTDGNKDIKEGTEVTFSVDLRADTGTQVMLKHFFFTNRHEEAIQTVTLTPEWKTYSIKANVPKNCTNIMSRIVFPFSGSEGKSFDFRNAILHDKQGDIPYIEGDNIQQRIDELDIVHESMIKITKE